jgi:hypothetical protein
LVLPKTFTNETFNPIARDCGLNMLACNSQPKPRLRKLAILPEYHEIFITGAPGCGKYALEFTTLSQTLCVGEAPAGWRNLKVLANDRSDSQVFTAFGTAAVQDLTTVTGAHAGTETVGALTFNFTGLKSSFHGRFRNVLKLS